MSIESDRPPPLYLVDASIYVFRGWFVLPDTLTDGEGRPVNAVLGFADFLLSLLEQKRPDHVICAFDTSLGTSVRKQIYPDYKANRPPAPADLKHQFDLCRQLVRALGIAEYASEKYEADDILGTFAQRAREQNHPFVVVTADKDLTQLLGKNDHWWSFAKNYWLDYRGVQRRFGVRPSQIADLLALSGDKVDNIPGIPGVGQTTAARLLTKWGNIDTLYANIEKVGEMRFRGAKRIQSLLWEHRDAVEIARQLTPILPDPSLPDDIDTLRRTTPDHAQLNELLTSWNVSDKQCERWSSVLQ